MPTHEDAVAARVTQAPSRGGPAAAARRAVWAGVTAGLFSALALVRRKSVPHAPAGVSGPAAVDYGGLNAPSHWIWGDKALRRREPSLRYTGVGAVTHIGSAIFWAVFYEGLRHRRARRAALPPRPARWMEHVSGACIDAAAVTAVAATVDLLVVPERLTPGFERVLPRPRVAAAYLAFAAGLALAGSIAARAPAGRPRPE